jgi:hypothetical protein
MTVVNIPNDHHFIGYIAIAIYGHFNKDLPSKKCLGIVLAFRDKGHKRLPYTSS